MTDTMHPRSESPAAAIAAAAAAATAAAPPPLRNRFFRAFDTMCRFYAQTDDEALFDDIQALCRKYDRLFSHTNPDSELVRLNRACGMPVRVDPELAALLCRAIDYCGESGGLFDITAGSLERLWNWHRAEVPTDAEVERALQHVGFHMVHVNDDVACIDDPQASIVLGGIAKGYIADRICDLMRSRGVTCGVVDLGGNMALVGSRPDGKPWRVGIANPRDRQNVLAYIDAADESLVTSGMYERFFESGGVAYHHIIDPRTGRPADTDLTSVTVVSRRSVDADGLTTGLLLMGAGRAFDFLTRRKDVEGLLVKTDGELLATPGLEPRLIIPQCDSPREGSHSLRATSAGCALSARR